MTETNRYILVDHKPVATPDLLTWATWFEKRENQVIKRTETKDGRVSTIFLGIDYNFLGSGPPVLFETLVIDGRRGGEQFRHETWDEAIAFHDSTVELLNR